MGWLASHFVEYCGDLVVHTWICPSCNGASFSFCPVCNDSGLIEIVAPLMNAFGVPVARMPVDELERLATDPVI